MIKLIIINGLVLGGMYSILAIGFALVFGVARILNMAHTSFYMIAAFLVYMASGIAILIPSAIISILIVGVLGMVCYKMLFDRIKEHETPVMIVGIALAMLIQEIFLLAFGGEYKGVKAFIPGFVYIAGVAVTYQKVLTFAATIVILVCIWFLLTKTKLGLAIRCASQDREIANIVAIDVGMISMITVGISTALAGIAGVLMAPIYMVTPAMWLNPLIITLAAVVLGGLGSIKGAVIAAFILGFAETIIVFLVPEGAFLRGAVSMAVMIGVLLIRPEGFFGVVFEEELL